MTLCPQVERPFLDALSECGATSTAQTHQAPEITSSYLLACCAELGPNHCSQDLCPCHRSLPKHERLVDLHGSVIDYNYGGGSSIAVLLIMERLHRDLYTGLKVRQAGWGEQNPGSNQSHASSPACHSLLCVQSSWLE